eukprot:352312-Chlamydomonas_euryale.AAC.22
MVLPATARRPLLPCRRHRWRRRRPADGRDPPTAAARAVPLAPSPAAAAAAAAGVAAAASAALFYKTRPFPCPPRRIRWAARRLAAWPQRRRLCLLAEPAPKPAPARRADRRPLRPAGNGAARRRGRARERARLPETVRHVRRGVDGVTRAQ